MGQQCLVAAGAVISARGVERRKLVDCCRKRTLRRGTFLQFVLIVLNDRSCLKQT